MTDGTDEGGRQVIEVVRHEELFERSLFTRLEEELRGLGWVHGWRSNTGMGFGHWNHDFCRCLKENGCDVGGRLTGAVAEAWSFLQRNFYPEYILLRCYMNAHTYGLEGYPHTDSVRLCDKTIVVYMNPTWRREWGGETMIYDGCKIVHAELPKENCAIEFPGSAWHVARGVTRICPELRVTLVFKLAPRGTDPARDEIQRLLLSLGCEQVNHGAAGPLIGHLLRVYDLLKLAACDEDVCAGGAIHSVFGTNAFRERVLDAADGNAVNAVAAVVGRGATDLAQLFGQIARPAELERALAMPVTAGEDLRHLFTHAPGSNGVTVTGTQFLQLCAIECANLADQQGGLSSYPLLAAHWKKMKAFV